MAMMIPEMPSVYQSWDHVAERRGMQAAREREQNHFHFEAHASELWFWAVTFDTRPARSTVMFTELLVKNDDANIFQAHSAIIVSQWPVATRS